MSVLLRLPARERAQAVLMRRTGLGWAVGVASIVTGRLNDDAEAYWSEKDASTAAIALADRLDLLALRSDDPEPL